jgi:hypothetical protein
VGFVESACPEDETLLMSIRACTFFSSQIHTRSTTRKSLSDQLKRQGYRVKRDFLSCKAGVRKSGGGRSIPRELGVTEKKNEGVEALKVLEDNFFGHRCSKQTSEEKEKSASAPRSVGRKGTGRSKHRTSSPVTSNTSCSKLSKRGQSLTNKNKSSQSASSRSLNLSQGKECESILSSPVRKESDDWYHPNPNDFAHAGDLGVTPRPPRDIGWREGQSRSRTENKQRSSKHCNKSSRKKLAKSQHHCTLTSDRLRRHTELYLKSATLHTTQRRSCDASLSRNEARREINYSMRHVKLRIVDARPYINAKGNALMGKGYEVVERLGGSRCTTLEFANIANIHVVKDSYQALRQACSVCRAGVSIYQTGDVSHHTFSAADSTPTANTNVHISNTNQSSNIQTAENKCDNWGAMVSDTKWLQHLSSVLRGGLRCAEYLAKGDPVLVHCSDGWDRTSQLTSLAQLLLDPEYRTICGFKNLISKDFVAFGHMFRTRTGGVGMHADVNQESPVFVQFLDAVWQVRLTAHHTNAYIYMPT